MGYIYITAVLMCWTGVAFVYRWAGRGKANRFVMSAAIGFTAAIWVLLLVLLQGIDLCEVHVSQVIMGCSLGTIMVVSLPIFLAAVSRGDLSVTWTVLTLSFGLTSIMVMIYPGERPTVQGLTGLALAAGAVALLGLDVILRHRSNHPAKPRKGWGVFMSISFVTNAVGMYSFKLGAWFQPDGSTAHSLGFLLSAYVVFGLGSLLLTFFILRRGSVKKGIVTGMMAGTLLVAGGFLILRALSVGSIPAHIFYPAVNGGSMVCVVALSAIFLAERPGRFGWMGIGLGAAALVLLGLTV